MNDPADQQREQRKLTDAEKFALHNPGELGKALVNWDDLAAGRYDEWIGNLAPDALAALATWGTATAISRSAKGAKTAQELAKNVERRATGDPITATPGVSSDYPEAHEPGAQPVQGNGQSPSDWGWNYDGRDQTRTRNWREGGRALSLHEGGGLGKRVT